MKKVEYSKKKHQQHNESDKAQTRDGDKWGGQRTATGSESDEWGEGGGCGDAWRDRQVRQGSVAADTSHLGDSN